MRKLLVAALTLLPTTALAHPGLTHTHDLAQSLAQGFVHPLGGLDHVLAMVAVGLLAAQLGGRALWLVPAAFVVTMAAAGALGMTGVNIPHVETGIALSVVVLGAVVALRIGMPVGIAMAMTGGFAVFHGYAHGVEMVAGNSAASGLVYALGFVTATAMLHGVGIAAGLMMASVPQQLRITQFAGGAMALAGAVLLVA